MDLPRQQRKPAICGLLYCRLYLHSERLMLLCLLIDGRHPEMPIDKVAFMTGSLKLVYHYKL